VASTLTSGSLLLAITSTEAEARNNKSNATVRDHRPPPTPVVRDHRPPPPKPIIKDHRKADQPPTGWEKSERPRAVATRGGVAVNDRGPWPRPVFCLQQRCTRP
jgi:hypothetical protein